METTPLAIQTYTAIINQTGTNNPIATVLHNTFPDDITITWERFDIGGYQCLISTLTATNGAVFLTTEGVPTFLNGRVNTGKAILWANNLAGNPTDGLENITVEIRLYQNV